MTSNEKLAKSWVVCLLAMICCFLWGSAFPCIKIGYQLFHITSDETGSQILFAGIRFVLAGMLVVAFSSISSHKFVKPAKSSYGMIVRLALIQTVLQYLLFYIGLANTTGVKSSIIEASNVFLAILVASLAAHSEKLTVTKLSGCLIGFSGVVLINLTGSGLAGTMSLKGEGAIFLSAAAYSCSSVMIKSYSRKESPVTLSGYQFLVGGVILALAGLMMGGRISGITPVSLLLLLYMALISAVAYTIWSLLLKYNPVGRVAVYGFMNPVCGVILSALLLGEKNQAFSLKGLAALVLVCIGIYIVNKNFQEKEVIQ